MSQQEITTTTPQAIAPGQPTTVVPAQQDNRIIHGIDPGGLIMMALEKNVPVETMERLMAMRDKLVAEQARKAYYADLSAFQMECPVIIKDKAVLNKDNRTIRYHYAPLDSIVRQIAGKLAEYGFSYQFVTETGTNMITVTCHARHRDGHTESTTFVSQIDPTAYMNVAQKYGSALTFGKRYAFLAAFGIMTGDEDDDSQSTTEGVKAKSAREKMEQIKRTKSKQEAIDEQEGPIIHQTDDEAIDAQDDSAEETPGIDILTDFLTLVAECEDADDLTARVEQAKSFEGVSQKAAKKAIMDRSKQLGLKWNATAQEFTRKGAANE